MALTKGILFEARRFDVIESSCWLRILCPRDRPYSQSNVDGSERESVAGDMGRQHSSIFKTEFVVDGVA